MKSFLKSVILIITFLISLTFVSCGIKKEQKVEENNVPNYSEVTVLENSNGNFNAFKIDDKALASVGSTTGNVIDMAYNVKNSVYVHSISVPNGENSSKNIIDINSLGKKLQLKDFYSALDLKLNNNGNKLAFRSFKSNSLSSAEGMKVYDIKNNKYLKLKSKVLVSGKLYEWIDENKIIYYGSVEGEKNSQKIYMYDFNKDKEEVYLDDISGNCVYFAPMKNGILILSSKADSEQLYYYDIESKTAKSIAANLTEIYKTVTNYKNEEIFILGTEGGQTNALYVFSYKDLSLKRLTYDFPKNLDVSAGLAIDSNDNIYFCGMENLEQSIKKDVYMYSEKENSVNLISAEQGNYSVYGSVK
ncbi:hypothetical protein Ccar_25495 [Clostridium carboxidivorans P7]|uniref:Lipoprotein n=1 Tax=Clostridium carboxidivorans P7 TaxID=536227 RepID=C6PQU2_9CLOT|nr:hypothetical protein [Clostridium carboxidivorans]AKN34006.1 hypothetical protein Ccar_25495 [Clostridium carboxidivorans P7]EET88464.1 conserved hypothetical protein [Clostridium carboxidivorans P7]EFG88120.1 lipoprotein, putative [Clostridium carboxidivorans P7]